MNNQRHIIWSNHDLNYEDWKDDLEAEYPDLSDDERYSRMYDINNGKEATDVMTILMAWTSIWMMSA